MTSALAHIVGSTKGGTIVLTGGSHHSLKPRTLRYSVSELTT
ncbi:hypothetical protein GGD68_004258 [Paraburkholderia fungorum]|jgi:hypothetical protein|uniref:Uncharacterized protein n=1 Tax=Paraburkholderia fungorum TaxID=134537 RepID=A0AAW3UXQ6_9BURK|nr:hypothetical protein [Paraburkholderia fungorum]MBB6203417.1 hypothetical protein [Paraburkholderia fungorum]